jgi:hypothetical protein
MRQTCTSVPFYVPGSPLKMWDTVDPFFVNHSRNLNKIARRAEKRG